jgi:FkbM family methyltransferase
MQIFGADHFRKYLRRKIRYDARVERAQQILRMKPSLCLAPIGLEIWTKPGDILIDCGANVGDVTSTFARTGATVYAFEPDPLCFSVLSKRFALTPNVTCFHQGVMDRNCSLTLKSPNAHGKWDDLDSTVSSSFIHEDLLHARQTTVNCIDLSDFIFSLNSRVQMLKIDIEGAEIPVINRLIDSGAVDLINMAVVETHEKQQPSLSLETETLRHRIKASGYESKFRLDWV